MREIPDYIVASETSDRLTDAFESPVDVFLGRTAFLLEVKRNHQR